MAIHEHPIIFSTDMIRAILDGWKTQTRRVIKGILPNDKWLAGLPDVKCPFGQVGGTLWVRESFRAHLKDYGGELGVGGVVQYKASQLNDKGTDIVLGKWRPSIFMPKWASRLTLEITDIKVQRLQEITEEDAQAEGVTRPPNYSLTPHYKEWFSYLWDTIHKKKDRWQDSPWVWAISFERLK